MDEDQQHQRRRGAEDVDQNRHDEANTTQPGVLWPSARTGAGRAHDQIERGTALMIALPRAALVQRDINGWQTVDGEVAPPYDAAQYLELIGTAVTARILGLKALPSVAKTAASIRTIR
jgi:hypothetical protein